MANPFEMTADPLRNAEDTRHRLLAADPFPPLSPPPIDIPGGADLNWSPDEDLRREMARLEAGYPAAAPPANGFGASPYGNGHSAELAAVYARVPVREAFTTNEGDVEGLRAENVEMHKLIEEMKLVFEQATTQEEATARTLTEVQARVTELEGQVQERDEHVGLLNGQIAELERHIQESPAAPPPTEDELAKLADELEKERCSLSQDRRSLEQDRQQLRDDEKR